MMFVTLSRTKGCMAMTLTPRTQEQRSQALAKAVASRKERTVLLAQLKTSSLSLSEVLKRDDQVVGRILVRRLLQSLPGIGPVKAAQLLDELDISPRRRVQGLGVRQKEALLRRFSVSVNLPG